MRHILLLTLTAAVLLAGSGCSEDDNPASPVPGTISGTLTYPAPAEGKTWTVVVDTDFDGDNGMVGYSMGTCGTGTRCDYAISGVPPGTYYVYAVVRIVSGREDPPAAGDYLGLKGSDFSNPPASPNVTVPSGGTVDCDITLSVYQ